MMQREGVLGLVFATWLPGSVSMGQERPEKLPPGYRKGGPDKAAALKELCQVTADTGLFSGAVLVAEKGEVIYKEAFGMANREWQIPNTTDTKFRLASVSKQFCTLLVMQLLIDGMGLSGGGEIHQTNNR